MAAAMTAGGDTFGSNQQQQQQPDPKGGGSSSSISTAAAVAAAAAATTTAVLGAAPAAVVAAAAVATGMVTLTTTTTISPLPNMEMGSTLTITTTVGEGTNSPVTTAMNMRRGLVQAAIWSGTTSCDSWLTAPADVVSGFDLVWLGFTFLNFWEWFWGLPSEVQGCSSKAHVQKLLGGVNA